MEERDYYLLYKGVVLKNRYEIQGLIGQGGFGITYIGLDRTLNMRVAIKEFYPQGAVIRNNSISNNITVSGIDKKEFFYKGKEQFLREARILAQFNDQEGIVDVIDFFEENNTAYIIMKYLEGITLKEYIKQNGVMSIQDILELLVPVMEALDVVHQNGVIHRDVSPDNIMIQVNGRVKLMDFGAARAYTEFGGKSRSIVLKPGYAPPEQYQTHGIQGPWTDIYALSATIYSCITGHRPPDAVERVMEDSIKTPSELGIRIPLKMEHAIMKGMNVKTRDRYQNLREFTQDLYEEYGKIKNEQIKQEDKQKINKEIKINKQEKTNKKVKANKEVKKDKKKPIKNNVKKNMLLIGSCLVVVVLVIGIFAMKSQQSTPNKNVTVTKNDTKTVPNIEGANVEDVKKELKEENITLNVTDAEEAKNGEEAGTIISQEPAAGEKLNQDNKSINVTVVSEMTSIQKVLGSENIYRHKYSKEQEKKLVANFNVYSAEVESYLIPGYLAEIDEGTPDNSKELTEDGEILRYKPITIVKSKGCPEDGKGEETGRKVRDIIGEHSRTIISWAIEEDFYYGISNEEKYSIYPISKGDVVAVKINGHTAKKDTVVKKWDEVELVLSKGPKKVELKSGYWSGKTSIEMEKYLGDKHLKAAFTSAYSSTVPKGQIIGENSVESPYKDDQISAEQKNKDGSRAKYYQGDTISFTVSLGEKPQPVTTEARPVTGGSGSSSGGSSSSGTKRKSTISKSKSSGKSKENSPNAWGGGNSLH